MGKRGQKTHQFRMSDERWKRVAALIRKLGYVYARKSSSVPERLAVSEFMEEIGCAHLEKVPGQDVYLLRIRARRDPENNSPNTP